MPTSCRRRCRRSPRRAAFRDIFALEARLCSLTSPERSRLPGVDAKRVDSIVPGVILVRSLLEDVARLSLDLFRGPRSLHNLPNSDGELLEFAALLHDIGFHIASSKHHKHAAYLIENAELQGFTIEEMQILAQVARYHRKSTPKDSHEGFAESRSATGSACA